MADIFQLNYEQMEQIGALFKLAGETTASMRSQIQASFDPLADGGWKGEGSNAFVNTMERQLFPALARLNDALEQAASLTDELSKLIRAAEEEAAAVFEGESEGFLDSVGDFFSGAAESVGDFFSGAADAVGDFWSGASEWVHGGLDVLGFIPGFGEVADGINGLIYLAEGRYLEAGISFAAMIPIVGDAGKVGKYGVKVGLEIAEEGGEQVIKEIIEEGGERIIREGAQEGGERSIRELAQKNSPEFAQQADEIAGNAVRNRDIPQNLIDDLRNSTGPNGKGEIKPVNFTKDGREELIGIARLDPDKVTDINRVLDMGGADKSFANSKNLIFMDKGTPKAGYRHVLEHAHEFADKGVSPENLDRFIMDTVRNNPVVGHAGKPPRPVFQGGVKADGTPWYVTVTISRNGYVVGGNPINTFTPLTP